MRTDWFQKFIFIIVTLGIGISLTGIYYEWRGGRMPISNIHNSVVIYVDEQTGVNYLIYDGHQQGGMTVRVDQNGKPIITKTINNK